MQVLQGLEDLEMTGEIGLVNRQEVSGDPGVMDVMKMIGAFTNCLESFTRRLKMSSFKKAAKRRWFQRKGTCH